MFTQKFNNVYRYRGGPLANHEKLFALVINGLQEGWSNQQFNRWNYCLESNEESKKLYQKCFDVAKLLFKSLNVSDNNSQNVWAYVTHGDRNVQGPIHNHANTATINMVYYLRVPQEIFPAGRLLVFDESEVKAITLQECDLLIFSGSMIHMPINTYAKDFRVALNLEIKCEEPEEVVFNAANLNV